MHGLVLLVNAATVAFSVDVATFICVSVRQSRYALPCLQASTINHLPLTCQLTKWWSLIVVVCCQ